MTKRLRGHRIGKDGFHSVPLVPALCSMPGERAMVQRPPPVSSFHSHCVPCKSGTEWNLMPFGNSKPFGKWLPRRDRMKIARFFNAGNRASGAHVTKGRLNASATPAIKFSRPFRDLRALRRRPGVETPRYFRSVPSGQMLFELPKGIGVESVLASFATKRRFKP